VLVMPISRDPSSRDLRPTDEVRRHVADRLGFLLAKRWIRLQPPPLEDAEDCVSGQEISADRPKRLLKKHLQQNSKAC
jgi:hypothetical protein